MNSIDYQYLISTFDPILELAKNQYYQLVLVMGGTWQDRTKFLKEIALNKDFAYIAIGLPLSRALIERSARDRPMVLADYMSTLLVSHSECGIALDHIEILFEPALNVDPLSLLQMFARQRLIIASWPGNYHHQRLTYAELGDPEYYSQNVNDLLTYSIEVTE
jgi:hypothetical protein